MNINYGNKIEFTIYKLQNEEFIVKAIVLSLGKKFQQNEILIETKTLYDLMKGCQQSTFKLGQLSYNQVLDILKTINDRKIDYDYDTLIIRAKN